jgi:hypothetical protein
MNENDETREQHHGGKFPNRGDTGLALAEFIDSAVATSSRNATVESASEPLRRRATDVSATGEFPFPRTDFLLVAVGALAFIGGWLMSTLARKR